MKKTAIAAFITLTLGAGAQVAPPVTTPQTPGASASSQADAGAFKPNASDWTFEVNFAPFSSAPVSLNYLRARYFMAEKMAIRTGVSVGLKNQGDNKTFEWALIPGIEKHLNGTDRLSPYVGAELLLAGKAASSTSVSTTGTVTNYTDTYKGVWADGTNRGYFNLGLNAVAGCDFYFSKRIYMGIEAGFGFSLMSSSDITYTHAINGGTTTTSTSKGQSSFQLGPNFNTALRLGFVF